MRFEPLRARILMLGLVLLVAGGCATTPQARVSPADFPAAEAPRVAGNLRIFNAAWDLVNRKHYDARHHGVDWEAAGATYGPRAAAARDAKGLYEVLNEMMGLLQDSHTHALTPAEAEERRTQRRVRNGFNLVRTEGRWVVGEVLPDSPAANAGVMAGWIALARNDEALGPRVDFRPREGEIARWEFLDEQEHRVTLALPAWRLSIGSRQIMRRLEGGFVYLRFDEFDGLDRRWLSRQLKENARAPGVVIDLRRNPGGETLSLGIAIGEFFPRRVDCGTFITRGGSRSVKYSWQLGSANYGGKVVILVDGPTGSAAEIFAAVLQDHGRATVVGRRTAGAVLASWFHGLPGGGELQLSIQDYLAPKGRRIEGSGVEPDYVVPRSLADLRAGRDADLELAVRLLRGSP